MSVPFVADLRLIALVTPSMNVALALMPSREEIQTVVFSIGGFQAPSSDGFTDIFFQAFWGVVGDSVMVAVLEFFSNWSFVAQL
ncbi:unnamed protein product [Linum trigynum]|uniref:Uncharacterized protein n=1 Tax=Linum trigynum TaxID=586398 RepID=A0AAV2DZV5_9ROSI